MRYEGDNFDEEEMVDWLTDPNVMEVSDRIERVNRKMLEKLMARNEYLGVVFCEWFAEFSNTPDIADRVPICPRGNLPYIQPYHNTVYYKLA